MIPLILGTIDKLLFPMCRRYRLHATSAVRVHGEETPQMLHRDDELFRG